jgi:cobalt-zinc-cadmium efflux system membrane fusion protein
MKGNGPATWARLLVLAIALAPIASCGHEDADDEKKAGDAGVTDAKRDSNRVTLAPGAAERSGITLGVAGPARIDLSIELPGEVKADSGRVLVVRPRFGGIVHAVRKQVGDAVGRGEALATIQSNESLADYDVTSGIAGRVVARGAAVGEAVTPDAALFTVVDLSDVWVEFPVYPHQLGLVRRGQRVHVARQGGAGGGADATIAYVGSVLSEDTRVAYARAVLPNPAGQWQPGLFVDATVVTDQARVAVAVPDEAIVRTSEGSAVFVRDRGGYLMRAVATGRTDGRTTEIISGLAAGEPVVVHGAFLLKSELQKSGEE